MARQGRLICLSGLLLSAVLTQTANAGEFIVKLRGESAHFHEKVFQLRGEKNLKILDAHDDGQLIKINLDESNKTALARELVSLMNHPDVDYVVPNIKIQAFSTPNDPKFSEQWSHGRVNSERAWDVQIGSRNTIVAVIDTGVDYKHQDLAENIWTNTDEIAGNNVDDDNNGFIDDVHGWDFRNGDADPMDETSDKNPGHGTHCAGIVGAVGNNGVGLVGMSQQVSIMPVRFLGADGSGDLMNAAKSIDYAVNNGAQILSASWGATVQASGAQPIIDAIKRASEKGAIFVAAAANDGKNNDVTSVYPANTDAPNMITVAASQSDDSKPSWSNFGAATVHLASPGHEILSTLPNNAYGKLSGTSMATPMVSGLTALLVSTSTEKLTGMQARAIMQTTGAKVAIETACDCRIDAAAAVTAVANKAMTVYPAALTLGSNGTATFSATNAVAPLSFKVTNPEIAKIGADGVLTASAVGETSVIVTDANSQSASSLKIRITDKKPDAPDETCPLGDPMICQLMCLFQPDLPWCQ